MLQGIDQIDRGVEPHSLGVPGEPSNSQRRGQVGFAGAWAADQHHVLRILREREVRQFLDQRAVDRRDGEVEPSQVAVHREACRLHLVGDGTHRPISIFSLQQVLHQPA